MNTYHFTIVIRDTVSSADIEDCLYEAGCSDALVCWRDRVPYLEFDREAIDAKTAVHSALDDIRRAGFHDLVLQESGIATLAEMATRAGLTRAALSRYAKEKRGNAFPRPMYGVTGHTALYSWPEVAAWLYQHGQLAQAQLDVTRVV
ncbi:MAG: XRE family transcriptional regulator [Cardiobacterium sp.]